MKSLDVLIVPAMVNTSFKSGEKIRISEGALLGFISVDRTSMERLSYLFHPHSWTFCIRLWHASSQLGLTASSGNCTLTAAVFFSASTSFTDVVSLMLNDRFVLSNAETCYDRCLVSSCQTMNLKRNNVSRRGSPRHFWGSCTMNTKIVVLSQRQITLPK